MKIKKKLTTSIGLLKIKPVSKLKIKIGKFCKFLRNNLIWFSKL